MDLWVPEQVNAEREKWVNREIGRSIALYRQLKEIDDSLDLVYANDATYCKCDDPAPFDGNCFFCQNEVAPEGIVPGRWHVCRRNAPPADDTYIPITREDGGYLEPHSGVLEELRKRDLWLNKRARDKEREADQRASEHQQELTAEQRRDEMAASYRAARRVPGEDILKKRWGRR